MISLLPPLIITLLTTHYTITHTYRLNQLLTLSFFFDLYLYEFYLPIPRL